MPIDPQMKHLNRKPGLKKSRFLVHASEIRKMGSRPNMTQPLAMPAPNTTQERSSQESRFPTRYSRMQRTTYASNNKSSSVPEPPVAFSQNESCSPHTIAASTGGI